MTQAVPNKKGTAIFVESTANGVSGIFYDLWKGAVDGTNGYVPVFIPWFMDPEYRETVPSNFEITPEETELSKKVRPRQRAANVSSSKDRTERH